MAQRIPRKISDLKIDIIPQKSPIMLAEAGERRWVKGYSVNGEPDNNTKQKIKALTDEGWPEWAIVWEWLGEVPEDTIDELLLDNLSIISVISEAVLTEIGSITASDLSIQPLFGIADIIGTISSDYININPTIDIASLYELGSLVTDGITITPVIDNPILYGTIISDGITNQTYVEVASLNGVLPTLPVSETVTISTADCVGIIDSGNLLIIPIIEDANITAMPSPLNSDNITITPNIQVAVAIGTIPASNMSITPTVGGGSLSSGAYSEDFEAYANNTPITSISGWSKLGDGAYVTTNQPLSGTRSLALQTLLEGNATTEVWRSVNVPSNGNISFKWASQGTVSFYIDGVQKVTKTSVASETLSFPITAGTRVIKWKLEDFSGDSVGGLDEIAIS